MPAVPLQPFTVVRVRDETGTSGEMKIPVASSAGRDAGMGAAQLLADHLGAASSCAPVEYELHYPVKILPEPTPAPGASRFNTGVLIFSTTDDTQFCVVELFGISSDLRDPADPTLLLLSSPALQALISAFVAGVFCNPFGYQAVECIAGLYELRQ